MRPTSKLFRVGIVLLLLSMLFGMVIILFDDQRGDQHPLAFIVTLVLGLIGGICLLMDMDDEPEMKDTHQ